MKPTEKGCVKPHKNVQLRVMNFILNDIGGTHVTVGYDKE